MESVYRFLVVVITTLIVQQCCQGQNINLNDLLAAVKANNNKNTNNINNDENAPSQEPKTYSSTSVKTQEFGDLQSLISAMKSGGNANTANLDIASLLSKQGAQQEESTNKKGKTIEISPTGEVKSQPEVAMNNGNEKSNNDNSGINLGQLAAMIKQQQQQKEKQGERVEGKEMGGMEGIPLQQNNIAAFSKKNEDDANGPPGLQIETEGDNSKEGHSRFTLQRSPDGGLMLVPMREETGASRGLDINDLMKKPDNAVGGTNRQQLQLTSLAQALYSPFPGDNILHLHLKGKDGKDGKPGQKGHTGAPGTAGAAGPKGPKGEAGTCAKEVTHQPYTCTPEEIDSLSSRVDYLEKICKKVLDKRAHNISKEKPQSGSIRGRVNVNPTTAHRRRNSNYRSRGGTMRNL